LGIHPREAQEKSQDKGKREKVKGGKLSGCAGSVEHECTIEHDSEQGGGREKLIDGDS
jgi:hypothetical protein